MKSYLISVVTVALCSSLAVYMAAEKDGGGIGKDLRMLGALCVILSIILPLSPVLSDIGNIGDKLESMLEILKFGSTEVTDSEEYAKIFNSQLIKSSVSEAQSTLKDLISQKFSIDKDDCSIEIVLRDGAEVEIYPEKIIITLKGQAVWKDPYAIEEYLKGIVECDCIVRSSN